MLDREKVARAIAEQRRIKGMTQKQLADILNVSYQAVSRWEQGLSLPSVDMIYDIAQSLETTVDFLLNGLSEERKVIKYEDTGLDTRKLYMIKKRLNSLVTPDERLLRAKYTEPVFFRFDISAMDDPVWVSANHVPGSKERFAVENGYDRELCMDLVSNAANNLIRFGVRPAFLQANIVCGNNDSGQILLMGEALKEACERSQIVFAGLEVSGQAVNYHAGEYRIGASVIGVADRKKMITGERITEGDVLIGLRTEGIPSVSYPFVKVILDRRPDIVYAKIDEQNLLIDELMKPNACYVNVVSALQEQNLVHGIFAISNSVFNRKCYHTMPKGLGAGIFVSQISIPAMFQYLYDLNLMDWECFLRNFPLGIGMVLAVPEKQCDSAVEIIGKYHQCCRLGTVQKDDEHPDARVWLV